MAKKKIETQSPFYTTKEAAEYLGLAPSTIYRFASSGILPHCKRGRLFFTKAQLDFFIMSSAKGGVML
jgi:excisionase family DNA binding protein